MGICICFHIFKPALPWNVVKEQENNRACKQRLAEHNKESIPLFTTTSVLMHVFHYIRKNLPFAVLQIIYIYQSAIKTLVSLLLSSIHLTSFYSSIF